MPEAEIPWDELHPNTRRLLSRRGFLTTAGTGAAATFLGFTLIGCSSTSNTASTDTTASPSTSAKATTGTAGADTLYTKLGGGPALTAVVGTFLGNVAADTRINSFFKTTNIPNLQTQLVNQIGQATGGPERYTGRDMKTVHANLGISVADFNALVEDLSKALDQYKVPSDLQMQLLGLLAPMQSEIVTK